jgi:hypothetical protein
LETVKGELKQFFWWFRAGKNVSDEEVDRGDDLLKVWLAEQFRREENVRSRNRKVIRFGS